MDDIFGDSADEDNDPNELLGNEIDGLSVRRDALNRSLNVQFRMIFNELSSDANPLPDNFCCGIREPDA